MAIDKRRWRHHDTYRAWRNMLARCYNPNHVSYDKYGGRGIKVQDRWRPEIVGAEMAFKLFVLAVGYRPSKRHSLERIDANKDYMTGNVRWATDKEQARNKRNTKYVRHPKTGKQIAAAALAEELGVTYQKLRYDMIKAGTWDYLEPKRGDHDKTV